MNEHFCYSNDNGNFHHNLADANHTEENIRPNVGNQHNVLHQITTLRTDTGKFRASKQFIDSCHSVFVSSIFFSIFMSCIFMFCIFTACDIDGPSFSVATFHRGRTGRLFTFRLVGAVGVSSFLPKWSVTCARKECRIG